jgi:flagellar biosynthetic protein FliQ
MAAMDSIDVLNIAHEAIWVTIKVSMPVMLIGLVVGLAVSLFQALTQIQEMTLAYVPKILAIFISLYVLMPYMSTTLGEFSAILADKIQNIEGEKTVSASAPISSSASAPVKGP